jgi:cysteinyl-tRNA synthetase
MGGSGHRSLPFSENMNETQPTQRSTARIHLYNTMSQQLELLEPKHEGQVRLYVCGPTVYDVPHAGHARSAVAFDVLVRHLKASGYDVLYTRNITDIDDKILKRSKERGEAPLELSSRMAEVYQQDVGALVALEQRAEVLASGQRLQSSQRAGVQ